MSDAVDVGFLAVDAFFGVFFVLGIYGGIDFYTRE